MAGKMSRKAQNYLKKIKTAANEYDLKGTEISIKQDIALAWADFMELNRAVEEREFSLQMNRGMTK